MIGLRRRINTGLPDENQLLIIQKFHNTLPKEMGINPTKIEVKKYVVVSYDGKNYELVNSFDSYSAADNFVRMYSKAIFNSEIPRFDLAKYRYSLDMEIEKK